MSETKQSRRRVCQKARCTTSDRAEYVRSATSVLPDRALKNPAADYEATCMPNLDYSVVARWIRAYNPRSRNNLVADDFPHFFHRHSHPLGVSPGRFSGLALRRKRCAAGGDATRPGRRRRSALGRPLVSPGFGGYQVRVAADYRAARGFVSGWWRLAPDQSSLLEVKGVGGLRTPRHTGGPSWRPPTGATSSFYLRWATASAGGHVSPAVEQRRRPEPRHRRPAGQLPLFPWICEPDHNTLPGPVGECPRGGLAS
jgi:hypothetical protein